MKSKQRQNITQHSENSTAQSNKNEMSLEMNTNSNDAQNNETQNKDEVSVTDSVTDAEGGAIAQQGSVSIKTRAGRHPKR